MSIFKHLVIILILCILPHEADAEETNLDWLSGRKKSEECDCGLSHYRHKRAVGGTEVEHYHKYPWMVAIFMNDEQVCGGTLIDTQYVLTAAHCLENLHTYDTMKEQTKKQMDPNDFSVKLCIHKTTDPTTVKVAISKYFIHPDYHTENSTMINDIAIIRLERSVVYNKFRLKPICLSVDPKRTEAGRTAKVAGWGNIRTGGPASPILREVVLPIQEHKYCDKKMKTKLSDTAICAGGEEGKDTCQGDSGGPLFYTDDGDKNRAYQIGITSWGQSCGNKGMPAAYTNIFPFLKWIRNITSDSPPCEMMNPPLIKPNIEDCGLPQQKCTNNKTSCDSGEYLYSWMARVYHKNKFLGSAVLIDRTHLISSTDIINPWLDNDYYKDLHLVLGMRRLDLDPNDSNEVQSRIKSLYYVQTDNVPLIAIEMDIMSEDQTMLHRPICMPSGKDNIEAGEKVGLMYWEENNGKLERAKIPDFFNTTEIPNATKVDEEVGEIHKKVVKDKTLIKNGTENNRDAELTQRRSATVKQVEVKVVNSKKCKREKKLEGKYLCGDVFGNKSSHEKGAVLMKYIDGRFYLLGIVAPDSEKHSRTKSFIDINKQLEWVIHATTGVKTEETKERIESRSKARHNSDDHNNEDHNSDDHNNEDHNSDDHNNEDHNSDDNTEMIFGDILQWIPILLF